MIVRDRDLIRRLMEHKNITARALSRQMGWSSHSYLNRILGGEVRSVSPDAALKLAYLLQVPVDLLFTAKASSEPLRTVRAG